MTKKNTTGFKWNKGTPTDSGTHSTTYPKTYGFLAEDGGKDVADEFLGMCERHEDALETVTFVVTKEANNFQKSFYDKFYAD